MAVLALDATTEVSGVAIVAYDGSNSVLYERNELLWRTHSRYLLPMINEAIVSAGIRTGDIKAIAVTSGPGSFTGIRIGLATAKGLAMAWNVPVVTVGTLETISMNVLPGQIACPVLDARRGIIYSGLFLRSHDGLLKTLLPARAYTSVELAGAMGMLLADYAGVEGDRRLVILGDAVCQVKAALKDKRLKIEFDTIEDKWYPRAGNLALLAVEKICSGEVCTARDALPTYFRRSEAEEKWGNASKGG